MLNYLRQHLDRYYRGQLIAGFKNRDARLLSIVIFSSFIEIQFTYHKIKSFTMYSSVVLVCLQVVHQHQSLILAYFQFTCSLASCKWNHCAPLLIFVCWDTLEFPSDFYSFFLWLSVSYTKYCEWKFHKNHWAESKQPASIWINECCEFSKMFLNIISRCKLLPQTCKHAVVLLHFVWRI